MSKPFDRDRDELEITFPRVSGYRVELPKDQLAAEFNDDSILELTPDLIWRNRNPKFRHHR